MKKGRRVVALLGFLAAAAAGPAAAQDNGLYLGAQGGRSQWQESCQFRSGVCTDRDWAGRAFLGYQFNKYLGVEAAYVDLGEFQVSGTDPVTGPFDLTAGADGFDLLAVLTIPLAHRFSLIGKGGAYRVRVAADEKISGARSGETSSGFAYGVGLGYDLGKLGIRAEALRYDSIGGARVGEDNVILYSLGLLFRFY